MSVYVEYLTRAELIGVLGRAPLKTGKYVVVEMNGQRRFIPLSLSSQVSAEVVRPAREVVFYSEAAHGMWSDHALGDMIEQMEAYDVGASKTLYVVEEAVA